MTSIIVLGRHSVICDDVLEILTEMGRALNLTVTR